MRAENALSIVVLSASLVLSTSTAGAASSAARELVAEGIAEKSAQPPRVDEARASFEKAAVLDGDDTASAEALYFLGELDEAGGEYQRATKEYESSLSRSPSNRYAQVAGTHLSDLRNHSEGGFVPLATLDRVRKHAPPAGEFGPIDALAKEILSFPAGRVKAEARMFVAESYLRDPKRRDAGHEQIEALISEPTTDPLLPRLAARRLVDDMVRSGELSKAAATARAHAGLLDARFVTHVQKLATRPLIHNAAIAMLAITTLFASVRIARARYRAAVAAKAMRGHAAAIAAFAFVVAVVGGGLASNFENGTGTPFYVFAILATPLLLLLRLWTAVGDATTPSRALRATISALSIIGLAFIVLEQTDPLFLDGFHL